MSLQIPDWVHNEQLWRKQCRKLRALARRVVNGEESVIEGSQKLLAYRFWMREQKNPDFGIFDQVDAVSRHLPVGPVRQRWAADSLAIKDEEIRKIEAQYRGDVVRAARRIYEKYNKYVEAFPKR
jgi:hypothetical protein